MIAVLLGGPADQQRMELPDNWAQLRTVDRVHDGPLAEQIIYRRIPTKPGWFDGDPAVFVYGPIEVCYTQRTIDTYDLSAVDNWALAHDVERATRQYPPLSGVVREEHYDEVLDAVWSDTRG